MFYCSGNLKLITVIKEKYVKYLLTLVGKAKDGYSPIKSLITTLAHTAPNVAGK